VAAEEHADDALGQELTDQEVDFSRWYTQVIRRSKLADYAPVRGCMVIRPYGYALWERMQALLDARIKATGHVNAYFPLLVPEELLQKEAEHVEGFAPEVAWVTHAGQNELEQRYCIRPTSEAIIGAMYSRWIESWRDLPVLINQWCNVMRWEKVTRLFLRTSEFLWQEGHTVHATADEAAEEVRRMLDVYEAFIREDLALSVVRGEKTARERFAGAEETFSVEGLMRDGRALQCGTSHNLGQHFARVFDITFQNQDGERKFAYQTSWGVSTRLIGALVMGHGDDGGLMLPPRVAPTQVVIVPIWRKEKDRAAVLEMVDEVRALLRPVARVEADLDDTTTPGWKFNEHELRGVPVRLEIGPRDVKNRSVVLVRRLNRQKEFVPLGELAARVPALLDEVQAAILARSVVYREENTREAADWPQFQTLMTETRGFIEANWCGDEDCEKAVQQETTATIRCLPLDRDPAVGKCVHCGAPATERALFAKAY